MMKSFKNFNNLVMFSVFRRFEILIKFFAIKNLMMIDTLDLILNPPDQLNQDIQQVQ